MGARNRDRYGSISSTPLQYLTFGTPAWVLLGSIAEKIGVTSNIIRAYGSGVTVLTVVFKLKISAGTEALPAVLLVATLRKASTSRPTDMSKVYDVTSAAVSTFVWPGITVSPPSMG